MKKILTITFPRSGQSLLSEILFLYWGYSLARLDANKNPITPEHNYIKNHDFFDELKLNDRADHNYLVQFRDFVDASNSWFLMKERNGRLKNVNGKNTWLHHTKNSLSYWDKFVHSWILPQKEPIVWYPDLFDHTFREASRAIHLQGHLVDEERLQNVIDNFSWREPKYMDFDAELLLNLAEPYRKTFEALRSLGYDSKFFDLQGKVYKMF